MIHPLDRSRTTLWASAIAIGSPSSGRAEAHVRHRAGLCRTLRSPVQPEHRPWRRG